VRELVKKTSPVMGRAGVAGGGVSVAERPMLGKVILRGDGRDDAFQRAVEEACGARAPVAPTTWAEGNDCWICWLGPNEWEVITHEGQEDDYRLGLLDRLGDQHAAVVDVSDYYTTFRIAGPRARDLLAKGTPLDLHPRVFGAGRCAGTILAKATVLIVQVDDTPAYDIQVRWSMAEYLIDWLEDAAQEYL